MSTDAVIVWMLFRQPHCLDFMGETCLLYTEDEISQQTPSSVSYNLSAPTSVSLRCRVCVVDAETGVGRPMASQ